MTHPTSSPVTVLAVAFFAIAGMFASNPIAHLIDCNDSFWAVACADAAATDDPAANTTEASANITAPTSQGSNLLPAANQEVTDEPVPDPTITTVEETRRIDNDPTCTTGSNGNLACHS